VDIDLKVTDQDNYLVHLRFAIIVFLALSVMALDVRSKVLADFRYYVESALYPVLVFADSPHSVSKIVSSQFKSHSDLIKENEKLSTENFLQRADILRLKDLEYENEALRKLLNSPARHNTKRLFAEVIDVDPDPYLSRVIVNQGTSAEVYEGMPVITDMGLVGQVIEANYSYSRVLLLTDPNCQIPIIDSRSSVRGICSGSGSHNQIFFNNVPRSADVREGDLLLTSGIGGVYPRGYPVAIVTSVGVSDSQPFAAITASPLVEIDKMRYVLMFSTNTQDSRDIDYAQKAKNITDNKIILNQQRVRDLIDKLSVKGANNKNEAEKIEETSNEVKHDQ